MKKTRLIMAAIAFASVASSFGASHASACGTSAAAANDPFGSCEGGNGSNYHVKCGTGANSTVIPMVGTVATPTNSSAHGVEACAPDDSALPIAGRVGVYVDPSNNVTVFADGDDTTNSGGAAAWDRVDVRPGDQNACVRRGEAGAWNTGTPNTLDKCAK